MDNSLHFKELLDSEIITTKNNGKKRIVELMNKEKEYNALIERLNNPHNAELKNALLLKPNGLDIVFHLERINTYIKYHSQSDPTTAQLMKSDYIVSLRKVKELMDKNGWE